jgi:hypothetical protein
VRWVEPSSLRSGSRLEPPHGFSEVASSAEINGLAGGGWQKTSVACHRALAGLVLSPALSRVAPDGALNRGNKDTRQRRKRCVECGVNWSDPPSRLCPGCEAYREHQAT